MCSMIIQRFRKQGSCKYLDQREGSKVKSGSELSDGACCFSGDATGTAMDTVCSIHRYLIAAGDGGEDRRRGYACMKDGSIIHGWKALGAAVKNIHIMACILETCTTRVMCVSCMSWGAILLVATRLSRSLCGSLSIAAVSLSSPVRCGYHTTIHHC